jgi:hypothetical protein
VGVTLSDVEAHLDRRALKVRRRAGDSKPARIAAAKAHFEAVQAASAARAAGTAAAIPVAEVVVAAPSPPAEAAPEPAPVQ